MNRLWSLLVLYSPAESCAKEVVAFTDDNTEQQSFWTVLYFYAFE